MSVVSVNLSRSQPGVNQKTNLHVATIDRTEERFLSGMDNKIEEKNIFSKVSLGRLSI